MQAALLGFDHEASKLKELFILPRWSAHGVAFSLSTSTFRSPLLLETLSLQRVDFDWGMLPLPNLTTLILVDMVMSLS